MNLQVISEKNIRIIVMLSDFYLISNKHVKEIQSQTNNL